MMTEKASQTTSQAVGRPPSTTERLVLVFTNFSINLLNLDLVTLGIPAAPGGK